MTFFRTQMLYFIWAVPVLWLVIFYGMRRRRDILRRFSSAHGLGVIAPVDASGRRWIKAFLLLAAVLFTAVALAGPRYGYHWQKIHQRGVDLIIALDCSRSMNATDIRPTRLERAKREVFDLLAMLQGDRVGLVAFAGTAFLQCPLTLDYSAFNLFLNTLTPDYLPVGGTNITAALDTAQKSFDPKSDTDKAVILITDGENTGEGDPVQAARKLDKMHIKLFCIGVGGTQGVPIPAPGGGFEKDRSGQIVLSRLDQDTLKKMAAVTGGIYVHSVAGDMDLNVIYHDEIRKHMEAKTLSSTRKQVWEDRFQWPLALALLCLLAEFMLPVTRKTIAAALLAMMIVLPAHPAAANDTHKGIDAYNKGHYQKALKHFIDAQLNAPDNPDSLYNVADGYYKTGNFDAAAENYKQVLKTKNKDLKRRALYNLGNTEYRRGNAKEAIKDYQAALAIDPQDRLSKENLEFVKKALKRQQKKQSSSKNPKKRDKDKKDQNPNKASSSKSGQNSQTKRDQQQKQNGNPQKNKKQSQENQAQDQQAKKGPESGKGMNQQQTQQAGQANPPEKSQQPSAQAKAGQPNADTRQAERMLNRLQDQPGRALMPATGKQMVEKDW
jgi:Ca-activated chloride channel family protein